MKPIRADCNDEALNLENLWGFRNFGVPPLDIVVPLGIGIGVCLILALVSARLGFGPGPAFALAALGAAWFGGSRAPETPPPPFFSFVREFATLVTVPLLFHAGTLLGSRMRLRAVPGDLLASLLRVAIRAFLLGGLAYVLLPWGDFTRDDPYRSAFFLGALWALPDLFRPTPFAAAPAELPPASGDLLLWSGLGALLLVAAVGQWQPDAPFETTETLRGFSAALLRSLIAAAAVGLGGAALGRILPGRPSRIPIELSSAFLALAVAGLFQAEPLLVAWLSGMVFSALAEERRETADLPGDPLPWYARDRSWGIFHVAGGSALFVVAGLLLPRLLEWSWAPRILLVWVGAMAIQFLISSAVTRFRRHGAVGPGTTLLLSAVPYHPGLLALGTLAVLGSVPGAAGAFSSDLAAVFLQFTLVGLLVQGGLSGWLLKRLHSVAAAERDRWTKLEGRWVMLRAAMDAVEKVRYEGLISRVAATSIQRSFERELRQVEMERQDFLARDPGIEQDRWTQAVRAILVESRRALEQAQLEGRISPDIAAELFREISGKWERAHALRLRDLFKEDGDGQ